MKILDVLSKDAINIDLKARDKKGVIDELVAPVAAIAGASQEGLVKVLMERERLGSTGIGGGIGIPHGKLKDIESLMLGFGISRRGVDFESMDGRPTHIFFLLLTPENSAGVHLKLLARISRLLKMIRSRNSSWQRIFPMILFQPFEKRTKNSDRSYDSGHFSLIAAQHHPRELTQSLQRKTGIFREAWRSGRGAP
jgi:PTS system nitrogen regulatory IIA component